MLQNYYAKITKSHLQLNEINLREIWRTATEYRPTFTIQRLVFIANPNVFAEPLRSVYLVVTDSQIIARDPNHGAFGPQRVVLEGALDQLIAFIWC